MIVSKMMKIFSLLVFVLLSTLSILAQGTPIPFREGSGIIEFKVKDYDPTTRLFRFQPKKPMAVDLIYEPREGANNFPKLLEKLGSDTDCVVWSRHAGFAGEIAMNQVMITCGDEDFRIVRTVFTAKGE